MIKHMDRGIFLRLSAARRRDVRRRGLVRRVGILLDQIQSGHPTAYCKLNQEVPILRLWFNVEAELQQDFRLTRRAMQGLQRLLQREQDHGWGSQLEVLIYVYWLAHGLSYRVVSSVFGVPKPTVHRVVHRVAQLIWKNLKLAIRFPLPEELDAIGQGFGQLSGTPVLNSVVGSVHDTRIMKNSTFYRTQQYPPTGYIILGDGGYPCLDKPIGLITPYKEPVRGRTESCFNYHHSRGRSIVERAFGVMKTRWRSTLFKALEVRPTFSPVVIATCAFLHNVCLENGDMLDPDDDVAQDIFDPQPPREALVANESSGRAKRDELAALISGHVQE
ncbi:hypothetical protein SKAU_G00062910 [Synaphobranchus kaupii]|uniref:DDE Tnp4 domain-containing protein n=1 Tax=Synaphobranchus kaupii TaxID=118154 RepID=A0A9Q1G671_SYNKA|nr:hypothetical protein SKAU_G00062910 [Synaphobranchus kaupii]